jgi:hypothetical protein
MKINLWYSPEMKQWRWTLLDESKENIPEMESGGQQNLKEALNDIYNTLNYWMNKS